jgi:hypothetical protein
VLTTWPLLMRCHAVQVARSMGAISQQLGQAMQSMDTMQVSTSYAPFNSVRVRVVS